MGECKRCGRCCLSEDCEHLSFLDDIATCLIHDSKDRPPRCVNFPAAPPIMIEECGYYFIDTLENNKIIKPKEI
jgi:hypothetical protein